jgi:hypothetical protein
MVGTVERYQTFQREFTRLEIASHESAPSTISSTTDGGMSDTEAAGKTPGRRAVEAKTGGANEHNKTADRVSGGSCRSSPDAPHRSPALRCVSDQSGVAVFAPAP